MARTLESELARLSRTVRRRMHLRQPTGAFNPIAPSLAERLLLIWQRAADRALRWFRGMSR